MAWMDGMDGAMMTVMMMLLVSDDSYDDDDIDHDDDHDAVMCCRWLLGRRSCPTSPRKRRRSCWQVSDGSE